MDNTYAVRPISHPLKAVVRVPGSKSLTNRGLLIAALALGRSKLTNALFSDDSRYFANALQSLGFDLDINEEKFEISIAGLGGRIPARTANLFIGNAGTAARFLCAFLTIGYGRYTLDGNERMRERPISDLAAALRGLGAQLETSASDCPPVTIHADGLPGGKTSLAGDISSQFLSALLMAAPYASQTVEIEVTTDLSSKPYIDMTLAVMRDFGVSIEREGYSRFSIHPARYKARDAYPIEPDASAASYFFAAPAVCGGSICVEQISRSSLQGDIRFLTVLEKMGCSVKETKSGIEVHGGCGLQGVDIDMGDFSDTAQTLAAIAPFAATSTRIKGIASSRVKETDRVAAMCTELSRLGVTVEELPDGLIIHPCHHFQPEIVQTYKDHRMAMAFSLIGLRVPGVMIADPGCVSKTFPNYFKTLEQLHVASG
jgi:3-phosphoshikimate 1-carboxyvinyltransferase